MRPVGAYEPTELARQRRLHEERMDAVDEKLCRLAHSFLQHERPEIYTRTGMYPRVHSVEREGVNFRVTNGIDTGDDDWVTVSFRDLTLEMLSGRFRES